MFNTTKRRAKLLLGTATLAIVLGGLPMATSTALAQDYTTGAVSGLVQDEAGTALGGAKIVLTNKQGSSRTIYTKADGSYRVPALTIGRYTAVVTLDGYDDLKSDSFIVSIGAAGNITFTLDSQDSSIEEIFVVGTAQAGYDFNTTTTGITLAVDEVFARTPIGRNLTSLTLLAPGTTNGDTAFGNLASIGGSSVAETAYYVNGLNITNFRTFVGASTIPFEFMDQVEIKTGGYNAEFGRAIGGVINTVTKSGTNEFHGGANINWTAGSLRQKSPNTHASSNSTRYKDTLNANFSLSGPIIEDHLFFYALYSPRNYRSVAYSTTHMYETINKSPFWGAKIDLNINEDHKLEVTFFSDDSSSETVEKKLNIRGKRTYYNIDPAIDKGTYSSTSTSNGGGSNQIYKYTGVLADWVTISAMYGLNKYTREGFSDADQYPVIYADKSYHGGLTGKKMGKWSNFTLETGFDRREAIRVDADFYFNLMGDHHVRIGWDKENLTAVSSVKLSGGTYYRYFTAGTDGEHGFAKGEKYVRVREYTNGGKFNTFQTAFYIQDSWNVTEDVTLNLGLRNDSFENRNGVNQKYIHVKNQWAPRIGVTWNIGGEGTDRVFANYGKYYLPVATNTSIRQASSEIYRNRYYKLNGLASDDTPNFDPKAQKDFEEFGNGTIPAPIEGLDKNLKPMYQDEFILGYEHDFENGWTVGVTGIYRKLGRMIEDVAIDAAVIKWAAKNGYTNTVDCKNKGVIMSYAKCKWSGFHQYVLTNPGGDMTVGLKKDELTGSKADKGKFVTATLTKDLLGYPKGERTYKALEITFDRDWDGEWSLNGSYTLSWNKGNTEGSVKSDNGQDDAGITTDFDQPGLTDHSFGYTPNDRRHKFKIYGAYALTDEISIGGKFMLTSPRKFGCIGYHPSDEFARAYKAASWFCRGKPTPRGKSFKSDWNKVLDLTLTFTPALLAESIPGDVSLRVDVFNVFNSHAKLDFVEVGDSQRYTPNLNYGKVTGYQAPRTIRLSASYKF